MSALKFTKMDPKQDIGYKPRNGNRSEFGKNSNQPKTLFQENDEYDTNPHSPYSHVSINEFIKVLNDSKKFLLMSKLEARENVSNTLRSRAFQNWLFNPPNDEPETRKKAIDLYNAASNKHAMRLLAQSVWFEGLSEFNRNVAVFLYGVVTVAVDYANEKASKVKKEYDDGDITKNGYINAQKKHEDYIQTIKLLFRVTKEIVKKKGKALCRESRVPKPLCLFALYSIPEPDQITAFKVPYHLKTLLDTIYTEIANGTDPDYLEFDLNNDNWYCFFREVFGTKNVTEVAISLLLEGISRIDKYKKNKNVTACYDSLTNFALSQLENIPDSIRNQMVDLYFKRVSRMIENGIPSLRVDLRSLSKIDFPNLVKSVERIKDKLEALIKSAEEKK